MSENLQISDTQDNESNENDLSISPKKPVKSTAVVKYSAVSSPATFAQLQCNTNLNLPPSNWLSTSAECYGLQNVWSRSTGFSSFRMAHMFPDCVGEVDVVSDAENIKRLLKLPYSHGSVSMMVHRVENTLLLDDFDIHKYLLQQCENDWEWLKKFFYEHVFENLGAKDKRLFPKANSRNAIQQKNLVSKFLYHSLVLKDDKPPSEDKPILPVEPYNDPELPEPTLKEKVPDPNFNHDYARNVVWTFENIQMLLGTDMPIFGGQTHPCISLRLRDATKPINVLTGIDYWLDNLMCNVPEVVMCYHLDGIVQKYELIKTEDLPNLDDAKFSPRVIRDIAQNILSFLKNNATKAGHTYWLFKGKNDDVVKLYDLTSLCNNDSEDKNQNPFTVPVAMLLYRVARNMKYSSDYRRNRGTIRMLLKNCVQLLPKQKYPQIVTSAHFMLSDLYVPADTDPSVPNFSEQSDEEDPPSECSSNMKGEINEDEKETDMSVAIKCLALTNIEDRQITDSDFGGFKFKPPPINGSVIERCQSALRHVALGLECLKYFPINTPDNEDEKTSEEIKEEVAPEEASVANPYESIPMPYEPLNKPDSNTSEGSPNTATASPCQKKRVKQKKKKAEKAASKVPAVIEDTSAKALLCKSESQTLPTWQAPKKDDNQSWAAHLKILLYEKASLVFAVQAEHEYGKKHYGSALRHILSVLRCQKMMEMFCFTRNDKLISFMLGRAGDCCFMTVQDWANIDKHRDSYTVKENVEDEIVGQIFLMEDLDLYGAELLPDSFDSIEVTLIASCQCYEKALALDPLELDKNNLLRRLGNIHNELGVLYMNQASSQHQQNETMDESAFVDITSPLMKSLSHLEAGVKAFEVVHDDANLALLHSNTGRLMRLCAHLNTKQYAKERHFYNKALISYQKALQVLGNKKTNPIIWDSIVWELSSTLFTMATYLQDYPDFVNKTEEELEREIVETFQKALKYCDTEASGPRQPIYQFRSAVIQHRLASLYHKVYRESDPEADNTKRKNSLQLSRLYYEKASKLLMTLEQSTEFLIVQLERVALSEFQAQSSNNFNTKLKSYQNSIELILQCKPMLDIVIDRNKNLIKKKNVASGVGKDKEDAPKENPIEDDENLVKLMEQRLQFVLKSLTKICLNKSTSGDSKETENFAKKYKQCYAATLHPEALSGINLIKHVASVLETIKNIL